MSLSDYEGQRHFLEDDDESSHSASAIDRSGRFPADFDEDEIAFAQELEILFSPENEELPPYFVQTLIEPDDQRFSPAEDELEQRVHVRVFQRLKLRRRLFSRRSLPLFSQLAQPRFPSMQKPLLAMCATFLIIVFMTVWFTGPSFAEGMTILLRGASAGVYQVHSYPPKIVTPAPAPEDSKAYYQESRQLTLAMAQQMLHFPIYWPQNVPDHYTLKHLSLCDNANQQRWADGPVLEFSYEISQHSSSGQGTLGKLYISEFKPRGNVLQVVQDGAARAVKVDQNGQAEAIYVDGQWVSRTTHIWLFGGRSELIYQKNGVIFWIVGDQRDNMGEQALLNIAHSLHLFDVARVSRMKDDGYGMEYVHDLAEPFRSDILAISPDDNSTLSMLTPVFSLSTATVSQNNQTKPPVHHVLKVSHSSKGFETHH